MDFIWENFQNTHLLQAANIWNSIVEEGASFPGDKKLTHDDILKMFNEQTETVCMMKGEEIVGIYILHPNNIGRCSHIANASYAVKKEYRGYGLGRTLVEDSISRAKKNVFQGLQFNAVVANNYSAIKLYLSLGFSVVGTIKNGYRLKGGIYYDTLIFLKSW